MLDSSYMACDWLDLRSDLASHVFKCFLLPSANYDVRTFTSKAVGDRLTDAATCSRNDSDFVF
jgi:hypothetical protein